MLITPEWIITFNTGVVAFSKKNKNPEKLILASIAPKT